MGLTNERLYFFGKDERRLRTGGKSVTLKITAKPKV